MNRIATLSPVERQTVIQESAQRLGLSVVVVEKDFWVCWMLGVLFRNPIWSDALVFKGGTSLSKVYQAIQRFSEDIDLSVDPAILNMTPEEISEAVSRKARDELMHRLEEACSNWAELTLGPSLEEEIVRQLGPKESGETWLAFERDEVSHSPVLWFRYPSAVQEGAAYIRRQVKLELGSLTDQEPRSQHRIQPWLATVLPIPLSEMGTEVIALAAARSFWEKATILHAEFHRDPQSSMPERYSRHYSDLASLVRSQEALVEAALSDHELRQRVVNWKTRFFPRAWARYDLAVPGTFQLVPPNGRLAELERDYREMRDMFLEEPPLFADIIETLRVLESRINSSL